VEIKAVEINAGFVSQLPYKEVRSTAKSTATWIWKNRHTLGNGRAKVLSFTDETPQERMSRGAEYTNAIRSAKTINTLKQAVIALTPTYGEKISVSLLVKYTSMNIKTVRKYLPQILAN
jgi:hypothetical protein